MHLEIFWETPCTQLGALLLDLFSSYNATCYNLSLLQSLQIVTFMLNEPASDYSENILITKQVNQKHEYYSLLYLSQ